MEPVIKNNGQVKINSTIRVVDYDDCKVFLFDTDVKRFEIFSLGGDEDGLLVQLSDGGEHYEGFHNLSEIVFPVPDHENWHMITSAGRYTLRVCLYRLPGTSQGV